MSDSPSTQADTTNASAVGPPADKPIAIVGGGITGLFCAYVLAMNNHRVELFESSDHLGGRIRSLLLRRGEMDKCAKNEVQHDPQPIKDHAVVTELTVNKGVYDDLEFCAEVGPMRIELEVQVLLKFLLKHLGIEGEAGETVSTIPTPDSETPREEAAREKANIAATLDAAHLEPFPQFSSPTAEEDPLYRLKPEEEGKNPLELMVLAMCRAIVHIEIDKSIDANPADKEKYDPTGVSNPNGYKQKRKELIAQLRTAGALKEPTGPVFEKWAKTLREDDYWVIAKYGYVLVGEADTPVPLHAIGFWNLMTVYLSHDAVTKVRDLGTFYHLLPENPNAAHWLTWQLRQLSISGDLQGIYGGMQTITKKLLNLMAWEGELGTCTVNEITIPVHLGAHVEAVVRPVGPDGKFTDALHVHLDPEKSYSAGLSADNGPYGRVILALPKAPAYELVMASDHLKRTHNKRGAVPTKLPELLDASFGFPMVKAFFVVRDRWWEEAKRANWFATRFPTREVHYWKSRDPNSRRGMVMLYTDRPATSFWANYVPAGRQGDVEELANTKTDSDRKMIRARLKQRLVQYINENHVPDIKEADIIWCAIMDWGRRPYGAGNHAWRPERRFWETIADLGDITFDDDDRFDSHVHICGEAFTDYTGFIEGSLRSGTYTLTKILNSDQTRPTADVLTNILCILGVKDTFLAAAFSDKKPPGEFDAREYDYLQDLKSWVENLDMCRKS
ncbi:FAD-dependent oxidoreductase [[Mycobacterium] crassicus]|uniref:FAD-dependent oxidoreductase n=1 Tax=[Mycobacterium] crassicus TaxID=2872309 RepID=A0ABU5XN00_9MYCO|nr:FAD-dependent oxidoreductase [Mycolicibacter sp. MYC098]MEB3023563.1 FAD-dependent oxidoreductase [Mycolicibacter sp. MYC098]